MKSTILVYIGPYIISNVTGSTPLPIYNNQCCKPFSLTQNCMAYLSQYLIEIRFSIRFSCLLEQPFSLFDFSYPNSQIYYQYLVTNPAMCICEDISNDHVDRIGQIEYDK